MEAALILNHNIPIGDCDLKFSAADDGVFTGYGSIFGNLDSKNDVIMPGAYDDVLSKGGNIPVYVNHGWLRGELPIGSWSDLKDDGVGLSGSANLVMKMPSAVNAYWSVKSRLVTGLSVAIIPDMKSSERRNDGARVIHKVIAMKEISIVDSPANDEARILDVKFSDELDHIETIRDLEYFLRDAGGMSKGLTKALISRARILFGHREDEHAKSDAKSAQVLNEALERINRAIPTTLRK